MQGRFKELDLLRGIAALAVVLYHYTGHAVKYYRFPFHFSIGSYGVPLFFTISGFVIFWTLEKCVTIRDFAVSRFIRLYPTYWAALGLLFVATLLSGEQPWLRAYAVNATMLQAFVGVDHLDIVYWSLSVELMFYA